MAQTMYSVSLPTLFRFRAIARPNRAFLFQSAILRHTRTCACSKILRPTEALIARYWQLLSMPSRTSSPMLELSTALAAGSWVAYPMPNSRPSIRTRLPSLFRHSPRASVCTPLKQCIVTVLSSHHRPVQSQKFPVRPLSTFARKIAAPKKKL